VAAAGGVAGHKGPAAVVCLPLLSSQVVIFVCASFSFIYGYMVFDKNPGGDFLSQICCLLNFFCIWTVVHLF
jgi:hypothetical protein